MVAGGVGVLIGISRIFVGVHWPSDIAAGAMIGVLVGLTLAQTAPLLIAAQRRAASILPRWVVASP